MTMCIAYNGYDPHPPPYEFVSKSYVKQQITIHQLSKFISQFTQKKYELNKN